MRELKRVLSASGHGWSLEKSVKIFREKSMGYRLVSASALLRKVLQGEHDSKIHVKNKWLVDRRV